MPTTNPNASFVKSVLAVIGFVLTVTNPGHVIAISPEVQTAAAAGCALVVAAYVLAHQLVTGHHTVTASAMTEAEKAWQDLNDAISRLNRTGQASVHMTPGPPPPGVVAFPPVPPVAVPGDQPA